MNAVLVSALLVALAAWLLLPGPASLPRTAGVARRRVGPAAPLAVQALAVCVVAGAIAGVAGLLWAVAGEALGLTALQLWRQTSAERRRVRAAQQVQQATQVVAGQLRIGAVPSLALAQAARDCAPLERAAATQAIGGDVARALRDAGSEPGHGGLVSLARAWELCERTGAPVASLAVQVSEQVRADEATARVVAAELSGPRSTARLLAFLPLVGLAMGRLSGGHPVAFLTTTTAGLCCLCIGVVLACAGVLWTELMAHRAQEV